MSLENKEFISNSKLLLFGEYSYFFGFKALGISLDIFQTSLKIQKNKEFIVKSKNLKGKDIFVNKKIINYIKSNNPNSKIEISSNIPLKRGYGSSASFCLCLAKMLKTSEDEIITLARELEDIFHGKSSGLDIILLNLSRGCYIIEKGKFELINLNISLILMSVKRDVDSRKTIRRILDGYKKDSSIKKNIDLIGYICEDILKNINDYKVFEKLFDLNEKLFSMGLKNDNIDSVIEYLKNLKGVIGAKMSGVGCGGSFFAVVQKNEIKDIVFNIKQFCLKKNIKLDFIKSFNLD